MEHATRGRFGGLGLKTISGRFCGFRPQNPSGSSDEEWTARGDIEGLDLKTISGDIEEFASRRSCLMKGAVTVG
jgi:hypothetical protein